jgi:1,6-anhydro-N-acetylmuramate kinase
MTGTSIDGLDAALVEIEGSGLAMRAKVVRCVSRPLGEVGTTLRMMAEQRPMIASEIAAAMHTFAMLHAAAIQEVLGLDRCDLVCVHGQTVFHKPPHSWQLMQPAPIVAAVGCPVVYDLRQADLALGGQGAPITPIADWVFFGDLLGATAVVNLGGFCNVTLLLGAPGELTPMLGHTTFSGSKRHPDTGVVAAARSDREPDEEVASIRAMDVCACNQVLDEVARRLLYKPFDENGDRAAAGTVNEEALLDLDGVLATQRGSKRSLGTGDEVGDWISRFRARVSADDLAATACEAIAGAVAATVQGTKRVLIAGGGVRNRALVKAIGSASAATVDPTDSHGVPAAYREAACFAVLGALCQDKVPITLPAVTGVKNAPLSGAWVYP